jgi:hypothetical protein
MSLVRDLRVHVPHGDPRITTETYRHLEPRYLRKEIDSLRFERAVEGESDEELAAEDAPRFAAQVLQRSPIGGLSPPPDAEEAEQLSLLTMARHRGFEPLTYGSGGTRKYPESRAKSADRDGLVTAIAGALSSAAAREPQALSRCVEALGLVLGALIESAGEDVTGADDERGCGDALPSRA